MSDGHSRMYPTDQVNGRCALSHGELGAALRRRVSGSAGADGRQGGPRHAWWDKPACGGSTTRRAGQVHAHVAHPPRSVPCPGAHCVEAHPISCAYCDRARPAVRSPQQVWPPHRLSRCVYRGCMARPDQFPVQLCMFAALSPAVPGQLRRPPRSPCCRCVMDVTLWIQLSQPEPDCVHQGLRQRT